MLTTDAVKTLVQALVAISQLDYCNSIFHLISAAAAVSARKLSSLSLMQRLTSSRESGNTTVLLQPYAMTSIGC